MVAFLILLIVVAGAVKSRRPSRQAKPRPPGPRQVKAASRPPGLDRSALIELYAIEAIEYQRKARATADPLKKAYFNRRAGELYYKCEQLDKKPRG